MMHVNIGCSDFDRSYDFYTTVVGMHPVTAQVVRDGAVDASIDPSSARADGKRIGESRTEGPAAAIGGRALGAEDGDVSCRAVLLCWDEQPGGPFIDLQEWDHGTGGDTVTRSVKDLGLGRIAIFVDDLHPHLDRFRRAGVTLLSEPQTMRVGATEMRLVCFRDPDGVLLELVEMADGGWNA